MDEIMKIGGWKTDSVAKYYIGATCGENVHGSKRECRQSYAGASELSLSTEFRQHFAVCARKDWSNVKKAWVRQLGAWPVVNYEDDPTAQRSTGEASFNPILSLNDPR